MRIYSRKWLMSKARSSDRAWEWEDGDGFSALTHDADEAALWLEQSMEDAFGTVLWREKEYNGLVDNLDDFLKAKYVEEHGHRRWVDRPALEDDSVDWNASVHDHWAFGRVPIFLIKTF